MLGSLSTFATEITCIDKLMPYNRYSGLHQVTREELNDGKDNLDSETARTALAYLINSKLLCKSNEVAIKVYPVCTPVIGDIVQSNTCFVFTNLGYFILSRDGGRNVNFIFAKDKKYTDTELKN